MAIKTFTIISLFNVYYSFFFGKNMSLLSFSYCFNWPIFRFLYFLVSETNYGTTGIACKCEYNFFFFLVLFPFLCLFILDFWFVYIVMFMVFTNVFEKKSQRNVHICWVYLSGSEHRNVCIRLGTIIIITWSCWVYDKKRNGKLAVRGYYF